MPASRTTWRPARSRTCRTRATSHPARATSARPGSMARRVGRRSAGTPRAAPGARARSARRSVPARRADGPGSRRRHRRCRTCRSSRATARPRRAPAGPPRARRRPRRAATRRAGGCRAAGAGPSGRRHRPARWPAPISVSVMPNLDAAGPDREPGQRLGHDVRVEPVQDVDAAARPDRARRSPASASASSGDSMATQRSGSAVDRGARRRRAGRPAVLPIPSSVIRSFGTPARRGGRPLAARDDVRAEPARGDRGDDRRDVVRLDRELAEPRVGERGRDRVARLVEDARGR